MKMFSDAAQTSDMQPSEDRIGGYAPLSSDIYDMVLQMAYVGKAANSEARSMTLTLKTPNGLEHRETIWMTDRENKHYYVKDGKKYPLPGFVTIDDLALLITGYPLSEQNFEEKIVPIYDYDAKKDIPKAVMVPIALIGQKISVAILNQIVNKNEKNPHTGQYEASDKTQNESVIVKLFHHETRKTVNEIRNQQNATFADTWLERFKGQTRDRSKKVQGQGISGPPKAAQGMASPKPAGGSLFNKP